MKQFLTKLMITHTGFQKADKLNFKTTGLPWQQSKQDQEIARNAQSKGILNPINLKNRLQPSAKNLKTKYNNLSVKERTALAKRSVPHSEIVTVKDQQGNTKTSTNPQAGAMSGADPVGEFVVGTAAGNLGLGLGKIALSKMGYNAVSHWARNSLLNETAGNLTKNLNNPIMEFQEVPLEDGFVYRTFTPSHGGFVKNNQVYNRTYGVGDVKIQNGKYYSVRQAHFNNPDKLWWDKFGHNIGRVVQVTKESNTQTLQDAANNGFNLGYGYYTKGYRLSEPIEINKVINYKWDPLTNTMVPSMPGKIINNKQTPSEILSTSVEDNPIMQLSYYKPTRKAWSTGKAEGNRATSYFFKQQPNQRFELVKDVEPNNYSVHFKTDRNGLSYGNKMQLFAKVADEVPEGANLSTWGSISKGGVHGINRFGKDFGFIQNGTRQLTMKGTKEPIEVGIFQKPKLDQDMVRLYRASGTNGKFTPSPDGTAKYTGMWFTDNPRKTLIYASNTRRKALKEGIDNSIELQYIDIPKTQLNQYKASNIIGNDPNIEYEINEDFLIPLNMKRNRIPLKGITGNVLRDSRLTIPELDPNVFKIASPIGISLQFLNNSQK